MSRLVFITSLVLSLVLPAFAQLPEHKPADAKSSDSASEKTATPPVKKDYSEEGFVIEQVKTLFRFEKDGSGRTETLQTSASKFPTCACARKMDRSSRLRRIPSRI